MGEMHLNFAVQLNFTHVAMGLFRMHSVLQGNTQVREIVGIS